jgi:hypothetical protein
MMKASAALALFAAVFWLFSALVPTPQAFPIHTITPIGGIGKGSSPALDQLASALRRQIKLSAIAAMCASASAVLQAINLLGH